MSPERLRRSFAGWTASRWLSSWPRHGFVFFPLRKLPAASMIICDCCVAVTSQIPGEVGGLVDKSLLAVERRAGATRFRMLDFVRQYASERLAAAGMGVPLADRHRAYFRKLAERADREL